MAKTTRNSAGGLIILIAMAAIVIWLLVDNGNPPPPPSLVGLWRFAAMEQYTVEFRPDSTFVITNLSDKSLLNHGAYVVDDTKDPAWIDIDGMPTRPFESWGSINGTGVFKGLVRFRDADVAEIAFSASGIGRPNSFEKSIYSIVIYRIQQ
jgi:hypothetical protein